MIFLFEKISEILKKISRKSEITVSPDSGLYDTLGINSFEMLRVIFEIEQNYDIDIEKEEYASFRTVGDVVSSVKMHTERNG